MMPDLDGVRAVADAVLLEGYLLYPYRASALKNRFRWTFGVLAPRPWSEAGGCEPSWMETQCLVAPGRPVHIEGRLRFLRCLRRRVEEAAHGGAFQLVEQLEPDDGELLISADEGVACELPFSASGDDEWVESFQLEAEESVDECTSATGTRVRVTRSLAALQATVRVAVSPVAAPRPLVRLTIRVDNVTAFENPHAPREDAVLSSLLSAHLLVAVDGGRFISMLEPEPWAADAAARCRSVGAFPVLAGPPGRSDLVLASPIILYDHPRVAPESPGDLFDATEIDEILNLRTETLTDAEKREARATDARARAIVDRADHLPAELRAKLHGALRDLEGAEMVPRTPAATATEGELAREQRHRDRRDGLGPAEAAADPRTLESAPSPIGPGARVRLRPGKRRTDAQDFLYAGCAATVHSVVQDIDGRHLLAVTLDDDPAAELHRWYGRFQYWALDEVEVVDVEPSP